MQDNTIKCENLRSKMAGMTPIFEGHSDLLIDDMPTGYFWCICTMGSVGPDGKVVAPERCLAQRSCFQQAE